MEAAHIEHIEAFLNGEISREDLEKQLSPAQLKGLDEDIEWVKNSRIAVEMAGLREQLEEALQNTQEKEAKIRSLAGPRFWLAIAAAAVLLVLMYVGLNQNNSQSDLYAQYEYVDPGLPVLMSQSDNYPLLDAMTYYGEGNYQVAVEKLEAIRPSYEGSDTLTFYLGASKLYLDQFSEAEAELKKVAASESSIYKERAEWMLVLTALKSGNYPQTKDYLKPILDKEGHSFEEKARNLLQDIVGQTKEK